MNLTDLQAIVEKEQFSTTKNLDHYYRIGEERMLFDHLDSVSQFKERSICNLIFKIRLILDSYHLNMLILISIITGQLLEIVKHIDMINLSLKYVSKLALFKNRLKYLE